MMALMASKVSNLSTLNPLSNPSIACLEMLIAINKMGMISGKLKMAINVPLLPAFEAIPDTMVRHPEKPSAATTKFSKKSGWSWIGLPIMTPKTMYPNSASTNVKRELYRILDKMMASGEATI